MGRKMLTCFVRFWAIWGLDLGVAIHGRTHEKTEEAARAAADSRTRSREHALNSADVQH